MSHEISDFRECERASTTVINAYLAPVMSRYLSGTQGRAQAVWHGARARAQAGAARVRVMQSNGGIISADKAAQEPVTTILSGPAGGVIGAAYAAEMAGIDKVITFDMGGTSTDVALLSGQMRTTIESIVGGLPVAVPMLEIHTVGAGGGSIARFDRDGPLRGAPATKASDDELAVSLGTVFVLNSIALLTFPAIGAALRLSQSQFGLWSALAIHDTSSVVGATARYGAESLAVGLSVKLARALWIVPVTVITALLRKRQTRVQ